MKKYLFKNNAPATHKTDIKVEIQKNAMSDDGKGSIKFPNGLTITDNTTQWNGTSYDIESMDVSEFRNKLTVNHSQDIENVVGIVSGLRKFKNKITISSIQFAIQESPVARFVYNMMSAGYLTDFSIETMGPWPGEDGVFYNAKLVGLSAVAYGNNKSAYINEIALNSMKQAKEDGLDTSLFEKNYVCYDDQAPAHADNSTKESEMKYAIVKNSRGFAITLKFKNSQGEETEVTVNPGSSVEVPETEKTTVEKQISDAQEPEAPKAETPKQENSLDANAVATAVKTAMEPLQKELNELKQKQFDNSAEEPMFQKPTQKTDVVPANVSKELSGMNYRDLHGLQINAAWEYLKQGSQSAGRKLNAINGYNLEQLQKEKKVSNSMTISDFGNFVISPELLTEIEGFRSDFRNLIARLNFRDTLSLQMAWLKRDGDINMQEVEFCDDGANGNLKPISEYEADYNISNLKEVAAVTPVCNAATRFLAVDMLADIAAGYRTDFDRKRAQLFIARLQQAVNSTGKSYTYGTTSDVNALKSFFDVAANMQEDVMNGVYIMSHKSYWELMKRSAGAGINTDTGFNIFSKGENGPLMLGAPYIIVPNELLPALNTAETRSFTVEGETVTITNAVFYVDLNTFAGRTSGGLMYDLSTEAAYEVNGTVKSAYQRNELVLRGSFFRGGAVKDTAKVTALGSAGVS